MKLAGTISNAFVFPLWQSRGNPKVAPVAHHTYDCASHRCHLPKFTLVSHLFHTCYFVSPRPLQLTSFRRISFVPLIQGTQGQSHYLSKESYL